MLIAVRGDEMLLRSKVSVGMLKRSINGLQKLFSGISGGPVWRGGPTDMIATIYEDGVIVDISPSAERIIGAAGNLIGRSIYDFVARFDRKEVRAALDHAASRGAYANPAQAQAKFTLLRVRRAGLDAEITARAIGRNRLTVLIRECSVKSDPADDEPAIVAHPPMVAVPAPAAIPELQSPSAPSAGDGPIIETGAVDLMADLAHELKTPLNAIMGFADAMRTQTFGPLGGDALSTQKYQEYADHIHASGAHLAALIGAAQDYAQTRAGKASLQCELLDPGALARECAEMLRGAAEGAGLSLELSLPDDVPMAELDARLVRQVLINLLSNAVKFTKEGVVSLSLCVDGGQLTFTVRDTGVGMNKITLAKLGGRYSDTHKTGVRGAGGRGLGLSLAFELARQQGGALTIDSTPGEGTTARFTAPLQAGAVQSAQGPVSQDIQSQLDRVNAFRAERNRAGRAA